MWTGFETATSTGYSWVSSNPELLAMFHTSSGGAQGERSGRAAMKERLFCALCCLRLGWRRERCPALSRLRFSLHLLRGWTDRRTRRSETPHQPSWSLVCFFSQSPFWGQGGGGSQPLFLPLPFQSPLPDISPSLLEQVRNLYGLASSASSLVEDTCLPQAAQPEGKGTRNPDIYLS